MRLLLDAHVSGGRVGQPLHRLGHDVRPLDREPEHEGLDDEELLALATADRRILVTHNVADFLPILREWAGGGRRHSGVILVYGIGHGESALVLRGIARWLALRTRQDEWIDLAVVVDRSFASAGRS